MSYANIKNAEQLKLAVDYFLELIQPSENELKEAYEYTMVLPESYYGQGSFTKWIRVGWALRNISDKMFIVWATFSAQVPNFDYSSIHSDLWNRWQSFDMNRTDGLTKRSIMHWAKKDAYSDYQQVRYSSVDFYIDQTINSITIDSVNSDRAKGCGDYDIAKVLYQLFKDDYVCVSVKATMWYRYKNHRSSAFHIFYEAQKSQVKAGHDESQDSKNPHISSAVSPLFFSASKKSFKVSFSARSSSTSRIKSWASCGKRSRPLSILEMDEAQSIELIFKPLISRLRLQNLIALNLQPYLPK